MKDLDPASGAEGHAIRSSNRSGPKRQSRLSATLSLLFRSRQVSESARPETSNIGVSALETVERELQAIQDRAEEALKRSASAGASGTGLHSPVQPPRPHRMELLREERESARRAMEQDILRLHRQLGTGIEPERIECLARVLTAHAAPVGNIHGLRFQERIEIEILRLLYLRAGEAAWERLETLLARTGLAWPLPAGPAANAPTEELQKQREAHTEEIRRFFLETPPRAAADLIRGSVEAWRYGYPARDSYLWLQTALRGVAAALRAEAFAVAAESWLWRSSELEKRILDCVADGLTDAGRILERGVHNAAEAAQVASQVDAVCDTVIPELVWRHAAKRLCAGPWLSWPATSTSSGEQVDLDLVCGMSVPAQAREQLVRNGHTFHFCSSYCRREFEQQPAKFIPLNQPLRSTVITNLTNAKRKEPL